MTPEQAAQVLGVSAGASAEMVRQSYQELYSDYHLRLTNAPLPKLKKAFQEKLEALREAAEVLAPGATGDQGSPDLPSAQPSYNTSPGAGSTTAGRMAAANARHLTQPEPVETTADAEIPRSALLAWLVVAAMAAGMTFLWLQLGKARTEAKALANSVSELSKSQDGATKGMENAQANIQRLASQLQSGQLTVLNKSGQDIQIRWISATFLDQQGDYKTVNSAFYGYPQWTLRPNRKQALELFAEGKPTWTGETMFYAMEIRHRGSNYLLAGAWKELEDGTFHFRAR